MNRNPKQMPTHELFAVQKGNDGKAYWTKIGAAWPHEDGKGFSLKMDFYPAAGQSLRLRAADARAEKGGAQ